MGKKEEEDERFTQNLALSNELSEQLEGKLTKEDQNLISTTNPSTTLRQIVRFHTIK